eukprot:354108-Chlamydomonas_euryale.AAC.1
MLNTPVYNKRARGGAVGTDGQGEKKVWRGQCNAARHEQSQQQGSQSPSSDTRSQLDAAPIEELEWLRGTQQLPPLPFCPHASSVAVSLQALHGHTTPSWRL